MFKSILTARINDLWNFYQVSSNLNHQGEKGMLRELFLHRLLEAVLPPHFGIGTGIVVDKWGRQSPQIDLVIFDKRLLPPILEENGHGIYPIDAVIRIIEVKSTLKKEGIIQLNKLIKSFSPLEDEGLKLCTYGKLKNGASYYPFVSLFAYETKIVGIEKALKDNINTTNSSFVVTVSNKGTYFCENKMVSNENNLLEENVINFLVQVLNKIEKTSETRKEFSLSDWF